MGAPFSRSGSCSEVDDIFYGLAAHSSLYLYIIWRLWCNTVSWFSSSRSQSICLSVAFLHSSKWRYRLLLCARHWGIKLRCFYSCLGTVHTHLLGGLMQTNFKVFRSPLSHLKNSGGRLFWGVKIMGQPHRKSYSMFPVKLVDIFFFKTFKGPLFASGPPNKCL